MRVVVLTGAGHGVLLGCRPVRARIGRAEPHARDPPDDRRRARCPSSPGSTAHARAGGLGFIAAADMAVAPEAATFALQRGPGRGGAGHDPRPGARVVMDRRFLARTDLTGEPFSAAEAAAAGLLSAVTRRRRSALDDWVARADDTPSARRPRARCGPPRSCCATCRRRTGTRAWSDGRRAVGRAVRRRRGGGGHGRLLAEAPAVVGHDRVSTAAMSTPQCGRVLTALGPA